MSSWEANLVTTEKRRYVLITAARNEESLIGQTIESVLSQTIVPEKWFIVSDGSTDGTDKIVMDYAFRNPLISFVRSGGDGSRNFGSQARALNLALDRAIDIEYDFLGCLDADVILPNFYFARILEKFQKEASLGIAGGAIYEMSGSKFRPLSLNTPRSVPGAVQLFSRRCIKALGHFVPLPYGGLDTYQELKARMRGFRVRSFDDVPVYHLRHTGGGDRAVRSIFRDGLRMYTLGYHPLYAMLAAVRRARQLFGFSCLIRIAGFATGYLRKENRGMSASEMEFMQNEQRQRLFALVSYHRAGIEDSQR